MEFPSYGGPCDIVIVKFLLLGNDLPLYQITRTCLDQATRLLIDFFSATMAFTTSYLFCGLEDNYFCSFFFALINLKPLSWIPFFKRQGGMIHKLCSDFPFVAWKTLNNCLTIISLPCILQKEDWMVLRLLCFPLVERLFKVLLLDIRGGEEESMNTYRGKCSPI